MIRINKDTPPLLIKSLSTLWPGIAWGVFIGAVTAFLLPTGFIFLPYVLKKLSLAFSQGSPSRLIRPWADTIVRPKYLLAIVVTLLLTIFLVLLAKVLRVIRRLYSAAANEGFILWFVCSYCVLTDHRWEIRIFTGIVALLLTTAILSLSIPDTSDQRPLLNPDRPTLNSSEDELDRQRFVKSLVQRLTIDEIPVIALIGAYGDGKTSVLNMLAERLPEHEVVVVRFRSSLPGDESTLVSTLFNSIGKELRRRFFVRRLGLVLNRYARLLSGLVPSAPSGIKDFFKEPSQQNEIDEITTRLAQLPIRRVIVLLDDMDRMQLPELQTLLKVIRGVEEYPKLSFVCAFNKNALVEILIRRQAVDNVSMSFSADRPILVSGNLTGDISADDMRAGYEYLEKFFPVQVPVPKLDDKQLAKQFDVRFAEFTSYFGLLTLPEEPQAFDKRFEDLWRHNFTPALSNVRKMKRYFNGLKASYGLVQGEVDLVDFMAIELLRQIEPAIYDKVFQQRKFFYYPSWDIEHWRDRVDVIEATGRALHVKAFDSVFHRLNETQKEFAKSLLGEIFPKVKDYDTGDAIDLKGGDETEAEKAKRIFHPSLFMIYFSLHVPEGYYAAEEYDRLSQSVADMDQTAAENYFCGYLKEMNSLKRMRFLDRVVAFPQRFRDPAAKGLAVALARESNLLEGDDVFGLGDFGSSRRLVLVIANRFATSDLITDILKQVIDKSSSDGFAQTILQFGTDREHNKIFQDWSHVNDDVLKAEFAARMKRRYFKGGPSSIYSQPNHRDWQSLITWYRINPADVREYLTDEFERRPVNIGKHLLWLRPSIAHSADSKKVVDDLFPLAELKALAFRLGPGAYSSDTEKRIVDLLLTDKIDSGWPGE